MPQTTTTEERDDLDELLEIEDEPEPDLTTCYWCSEDYPEEDMVYIRDWNAHLCVDCEIELVHCEDCERPMHSEDSWVCESCSASICESCARYGYDDMYYCTECYEGPRVSERAHEQEEQGVMGWSYRPKFDFAELDGKGRLIVKEEATPGQLYIGLEVEAEMTRGSMYSPNAAVARLVKAVRQHYPEQGERLFFKHDGSLYNGAELIIYPSTPEAMLKTFPWDLLQAMYRLGFRAFKRGTAGIHIHVARSAFTSKSHLMRWLLLQNRNPGLCMIVGQRGSTNYSTWDAAHDYRKNVTVFAKGERTNGHRYLAINLQPPDTVELRYFRGNLFVPSVKKNIEWVQATFEYTRDLTYADVRAGGLDWPAFRRWLQRPENAERFRNLIGFLSKKGEM